MSAAKTYEIRADYDATSVVVYQAYNDRIADPALAAQRFVAPFSFKRMTWVKPSFCWLMHRSNWGRKSGQERILRVRIARSGWEEALGLGVLTSPVPAVHGSREGWDQAFRTAQVHVQWDTERSIRGAALSHYSIQVGITRHLIQRFVDEWILSIEDLTPTVRKIRGLIDRGGADKVARHMPRERVYTPAAETARRLLIAG